VIYYWKNGEREKKKKKKSFTPQGLNPRRLHISQGPSGRKNRTVVGSKQRLVYPFHVVSRENQSDNAAEILVFLFCHTVHLFGVGLLNRGVDYVRITKLSIL